MKKLRDQEAAEAQSVVEVLRMELERLNRELVQKKTEVASLTFESNSNQKLAEDMETKMENLQIQVSIDKVLGLGIRGVWYSRSREDVKQADNHNITARSHGIL